MSSAKVKRHLKLLLKHPLQLSFIPILVSAIASTYMMFVAVFYIGYTGAVVSNSQYSVNKIPVPVNMRYAPSQNSAPVYNVDPNTDEELLTPDETDEQFEKDMKELLMDFGSNVQASNTTENVVLGSTDEVARTNAVPVEKRMYNDRYTQQFQPDVNVITPADSFGLFSLKNVVVPIIALGFAVLGVNYLEHKESHRRKLATSHKKRVK